MRRSFRSCVVVAALLVASSAQSALMDYTITVSGPFFGNGPGGVPIEGEPFGLPLPEDMTTLTAFMRLDSSLSAIDVNDPNALVDFEMVTGSKTWTEADLNPLSTFFALFQGDVLQSFGISFRDASLAAIMNISNVNTWGVVQTPYPGANYDNSRYCNGCVSVAVAPDNPVPEPGTAALLLMGGALLWMARGAQTTRLPHVANSGPGMSGPDR